MKITGFRFFFGGTSALFLLFIAVLLTAPVASGFETQFELAGREELGAVLCRWSDAGLAVRIAHGGDTNVVRIAPGATRADRPAPGARFQPPPAIATNRVWLCFKRQPRGWTLYLADAPVARFPEAGIHPVAVAIEPADLPDEPERDSYTQRLGAFRFDDAFMVPDGEKLAETWEPISGAWSLHAVTNHLANRGGTSRPGRGPTPARSPNFYSLFGVGTQAVVLAGESFHDAYSVRAAVQHNAGANGIVFLVTESGDAHGLTARTDPETEYLVIELWRGSLVDGSPRRILNAFQTDLTSGQWLQLEAVVFDDRIVILADGVEMLRRHCPDLPPGGRYGLIACAVEGTRFDDFSVSSHEEYPFDCAEALADATRSVTGRVALRGFAAGATLPRPATITFSGRGERVWRFGADTDAPHRLSARFLPEPSDAPFTTLGLMLGNGTPDAPAWHFTCLLTATNRLFTLSRLDGTNAVAVERMSLPPADGRDIRLTLDALRAGELRAFADDRQLLFHRTEQPLGGLGAITVAGGRVVSVSLPEYTTRSVSFADRFEKNLQYVNDPFMRHWASPEGQWHTARDNRTWLRGDVIRRVRIRMPATAAPSAIHLATDETGSNAVCRIEVRDGMIHGFIAAQGDEPCFSVPVTNVPIQKFEGNVEHRLYTVGLEDHLFWLGDDTRLLASAHLQRPAGGRRVRIEGFNEAALRFSLVRRENVFDTLFNESLQNWTINGGTWEVVNRFQCEPTWSHMNGENPLSLAALWSKYEFSGDFCAELYAGMRHGWYDRAGDLNLTVFSKRGAAGDGYTVTVTGWDPDHSQNDTRLFRNGVVLTNTTDYLVPRIREGNVRRGGYEPLVRGGRDIHGAWYGIRLSRVGDRLQLVFDNLPVLETTDPDPLAGGCFGIWTFRNSMMVARVRIAAETIRPRPFAFHPIQPPATAAAAPPPGEPEAFELPPLTVGGLPLNLLTPACWVADDPVSRPVVRFREGDAGAEMQVTAHQGGGTFLVSNRVPPVAASRLLGWRFDIARSADAAFNLEFSSGRSDAAAFVPAHLWSFVLSGSDESRGPRRVAGRADVPPSPAPNEPRWTTVHAWLPCEVLSSGLAVRLDGFGNLQPSDVQQGLAGNPPGAWYAVRNFRPIFRGLPELGGVADPEAFKRANAFMAQQPPERLNTWTVPAEIAPGRPVVEWAIPSDASFGLAAKRDPDEPDTATLSSTSPWNSPLLPPRSVQVDDRPAAFTFGNAVTRVFLPRKLKSRQPVLSVQLADGRTFRQTLEPPPAPPGTPPVLLTLELPEGSLKTFDDRPLDLSPFSVSAAVNLMRGGGDRGAALAIANRGAATRLEARLATAYDPLVTPLIQFAYRAEPMSRVSLLSGRLQMRFTEPWGQPVMAAGSLAMDGEWQVWLGAPLASGHQVRLAEGLDAPAAELRIGSRHGQDQTGRYSALLLDDLAFGPAVGPSRILAFRAVYDDADDDLAAVEYALVQGAQPWAMRERAEQAAANWLSVTNGEVATPAIASLPEGIHHLVVRARDAAGNLSAAADMPFLLDRTPPTFTHTVAATDLYNKTCLQVAIAGGHAPPSFRNMRVTGNGTALALASDNGRATFSASGVQLEIDWPWLLRRQIQNAKPGETITLAFSDIVDIAGNAMPRVEIPITPDPAADKTPPTVLDIQRPANVEAWLTHSANLAAFFQQPQVAGLQNKAGEDGSLVSEFKTADNGSSALRRAYPANPGWVTEKHGWFGFSIRTLAGDTNAPPVIEVRLVPRAIPEKAAKPKANDAYTLLLPAPGATHPAVHGALTWEAGAWQNILINAHDFLRAETGMDAVPDIREIVIVFPEKISRAFQIRAAAVLAPYGADDIVRFRAYDASGIAGLVWPGGKSEHPAIRPSCVFQPPNTPWLDIRVNDRVGNLSPIYLIPVPPVALPQPLPAEVPEQE